MLWQKSAELRYLPQAPPRPARQHRPSPTPPHNCTPPLFVRFLHLSSRVVLSLTSLTSPHRSFFLLLHVVPPHIRRKQFQTPPLPEWGCRIFAVSKNPPDGKSVKEQQDALAKECSSFIATKLNELMKLGKAGLTKEEMPKFPRDTSLMQGVGALWDAPTLEGNSQSPGPKGKSSVVTESLTPG